MEYIGNPRKCGGGTGGIAGINKTIEALLKNQIFHPEYSEYMAAKSETYEKERRSLKHFIKALEIEFE
jgi:hypothetical protein